MKKRSVQLGFTMVELILVIVVTAILAVVIGPKLLGREDYTPFNSQAKFISILRSTQLKAMQQRGVGATTCHRVIFRDNAYGNQANSNVDCNNDIANVVLADNIGIGGQGERINDVDAISINIDNNNGNQSVPAAVGFDAWGRPLDACSGGCAINIEGLNDTARVCIESEGFIHAC